MTAPGIVLPGTQQTLSHYHPSHGLMTVTYQCLYILPKRAIVPMADGTSRELTNGIRISRAMTFKGHTTETPELYIMRQTWPELGHQRCPLCHQRLDGEA